MRVAFEATAACRPFKTGIGRYAIELMRALARQRDQTRAEDRFDAYYRFSRRWKADHRTPRIDGVATRWYQEPLPPILQRHDIAHGLDVRIPRWPWVRRVATLHDLFSIVSVQHVRESLRDSAVAGYHDIAQRSERIIVVSECTRRDFLELFDYPPEHVRVVHHGVDPSFRPRAGHELAPMLARFGLENEYLLFVGDVTPRKNLIRLVRAYARSKASADFDLVIVGARSFRAAEIEREIGSSQRHDRIHRLGYVEGDDLHALYAGAAAFLFPTLYEGFGLPVLEAFASGTPVLSSNASSIPEIAEDYALLVDPEDDVAIAEGIDQVLDCSPERLEAARRHAAQFTWERCAQRTYAVYKELIES